MIRAQASMCTTSAFAISLNAGVATSCGCQCEKRGWSRGGRRRSGRGRAEVLYWGFSVSFPLEITVAVYCGIILLAVMYNTIVSYAVYVTFAGRTGVFASWHLFPGFLFFSNSR
jgi:hypothetical protein